MWLYDVASDALLEFCDVGGSNLSADPEVVAGQRAWSREDVQTRGETRVREKKTEARGQRPGGEVLSDHTWRSQSNRQGPGPFAFIVCEKDRVTKYRDALAR